MRESVLFVSLYGIGNCILSTPCIEALGRSGYSVDVLVRGWRSSDVAFLGWNRVDRIWHDFALVRDYETVLWSHPAVSGAITGNFRVFEVNPRCADPLPYFRRFQQHEVLEVMTLAQKMGYSGETPKLRPPYARREIEVAAKSVAIGIGYLKDGRWNHKHWGNRSFSDCCARLKEYGFQPILVGDRHDHQCDGSIIEADGSALSLCGKLSLAGILDVIKRCVGYIGNDTGLMHAAAAFEIPTVGIFNITDPIKNGPWGGNCCVMRTQDTPDEVVQAMLRLVGK